jgi:hypothetical protein
MPFSAPGLSVGVVVALRGERRDRLAQQLVTVPVITPILYVVSIVALVMGIALWLSAWDLLVPRGQAVYVLGLIALLAFAAVEVLLSRPLLGDDHLRADAPQRDGRRQPPDAASRYHHPHRRSPIRETFISGPPPPSVGRRPPATPARSLA